jgi:hypothetical protein
LKAKGEERVSLIVRVGDSSPSNAPSRKDLQIDSDIVGDGWEELEDSRIDGERLYGSGS